MQPEHRGYSRCSDFFMCVRHGAHESAALTIINVDAAPPQKPGAPGDYQNQAVTSSYLVKSLQYCLFQSSCLPRNCFRI